MTDINKFSLGKDGKLGEIDFSKIKSGLKGSELIKDNEKLKSIFSRIDKNGDGKLDRTELDSLQELLAELSGDDNLSMKEAKKLEDEDGKLGRGGAKLLMELLNKMSEAAKAQGIKNVETRTGGGIEVVTYEDGHTEEVFEDGSVITTVKNGDKTTKTHKDKDGNLLNETVMENGVETTTTYSNGVKTLEVQTTQNTVKTTNFNSDGTPKDMILKDDSRGIIEYYEYKGRGEVLTKRVDTKNNSETVYYGDVATTTQINGDTTTVTEKVKDRLSSITSTRTNENNQTERTFREYFSNDYTEYFYIDDTVRYQKMYVDGKEYEVHYDADGNTEGVVVQNGESIALIAKRFGCSVEDIIKLNKSKLHGKAPKLYFTVGEEIKIPKRVQADAPELTSRKSREEVIGEYRAHVEQVRAQERAKAERIAAERAQRAEDIERQRQQQEVQAENERKKAEAKAIAQEIYNACDDEAAAVGKERFQNALRRVNKDNIIDVLKAYKEIRPDESIIEVIANEKGSSCSARSQATKYLANVLYEKGKEVGADLDDLLEKFYKEVDHQYGKWGVVDCSQMDTILDSMLGAVIAKMTEADDISESEAIEQVGGMAQGDSDSANNDFDSAREGEGWIARVSDTVCGWFGCKTIDEMKKKLGAHAAEIMKLVNAKDETEFKRIFKEVFGVEFDKQKVAAYNKALENYMLATSYNEMGKVIPELLQAGSMPENRFKEEIKKKLNYTDADLEILIFTNAKEGESVTDTLMRCLYDLNRTCKNELAKLTEGGSLDSMAQDIELIKKGLFGTKDIVKEVAVFNNNMQITEAVGTGVFEILGTVALGFIPGGQGLATARIAAMAAKYGRLAKVVANGVKVVRTSVQAGVATAAVLGTDGRSMDEIKQHIKTNMAFAAGGAAVSKLAPFVAKTFKLTSSIAKEVTEDVMDMFVSYCTSKGLGMDYGKTDAGIDLFMGMLMARISHMNLKAKSAKAMDNANVKPDAPEGGSKPNGKDKTPSKEISTESAKKPDVSKPEEHGTTGVKPEHSAENAAAPNPTHQAAEPPKADNSTGTSKTEETPNAGEKADAAKPEGAQKADKSNKSEKNSETSETKSASEAEKADNAKKSEFSAEELGVKLGKKLARGYYAVIKAIENMVSVADYKKIYKRIGVKFKNHMDVAKDLWNRLKLRAKELGLKVEKQFDDIKTKGAKKSNIEAKYRRTSDEFIPDELVRNAGNGGKPINENYVKASKDLREHYNRAIANGTYADSFENYVQTIIQGHKVAYGGFDGKHTWYNTVGQGSIDVNPGKIRGDGTLYSNRTREGQIVEGIARKYGDKYSTRGVSQVKLDGIPDAACPVNKGTEHIYPDGRYMHKYFEQMQRTAKEAIELIEKGAAQDKILAKLAEHYQYAANARPFGQINNSLFMNEINTLLQKAGMKPMPHGILDHVAQRMQPEAFKKYFIDEYKKTALDAPTQAKTGSEQKANSEFNKRGQLNSNEYSFYNFDDLKRKMADKFNLFSQNTQDRILQDLATKGRCRLQKNGVEYQFTVNNGRARLEEFDINAKYDIKQSRIDEYTTQKTYNIEDVDDIYFAISDELDLFSSKTQNSIVASLSGGQSCVFRKYGIQFEFKIDRSGKITVTEFEYERFQNGGYYQRSNGSQDAGSADNAQNYSRNMKPETRQAIEDLKNKIRDNNVSISELEKKVDRLNNELKKKFVLPPTQVKEYKAILGLPENAEVTASSLKAAYGKAAFKAHSDYGGSGGEAIAKIDEAYKALKKHYGFEGVNKAKIESEIADTQQAIEERKKEIAEYEDKINQLMNE